MSPPSDRVNDLPRVGSRIRAGLRAHRRCGESIRRARADGTVALSQRCRTDECSDCVGSFVDSPRCRPDETPIGPIDARRKAVEGLSSNRATCRGHRRRAGRLLLRHRRTRVRQRALVLTCHQDIGFSKQGAGSIRGQADLNPTVARQLLKMEYCGRFEPPSLHGSYRRRAMDWSPSQTRQYSRGSGCRPRRDQGASRCASSRLRLRRDLRILRRIARRMRARTLDITFSDTLNNVVHSQGTLVE